jgi:hypothetical protein
VICKIKSIPSANPKMGISYKYRKVIYFNYVEVFSMGSVLVTDIFHLMMKRNWEIEI